MNKPSSQQEKALSEIKRCTEETCAGFSQCFRAITNAEVARLMEAGQRVSTFQKRRTCYKETK